MTEPLLAAVGWDVPGTLDAVVCVDEVGAGRPAPDMIRAAMARLAVTDPARVLVAGDTVLDVVTAVDGHFTHPVATSHGAGVV